MPAAWIQRRASLAIVYLGLIGLTAAILIPLLAQVGQQAVALARQLPAAIAADPLSRLPLPSWLEPIRESLTAALHNWFSSFDSALIPVLEGLGSRLGGFLGGAVNRLLNAGLPKGGLSSPPTQGSLSVSNQATYVPTKMEISINLFPIQSRQQVSKQFSVKEFANGNLLRGGFW